MRRRSAHLEFINPAGEIAQSTDEIVAFLRYEHIGRLRWEWSLRTVTILHTSRVVPSVGHLIAMGTGITKTNALCRAQTMLTQYLNHLNHQGGPDGS